MALTVSAPHAAAPIRRIYLLRHGEAAYFDPSGQAPISGGASLTERGRAQAQAVAQALTAVQFDKAVASGLPRTQETAAIVLGARRLPLEVWEEFQEIRRGDLAHLPDDQLERAFTGVFRGRIEEGRAFLGGETFGSLLDRVLPALGRLLAEPSWNTLLLTLHGAVNRAILSHALTGGRSVFGHLEQAPACVNILDLNPRLEGGWIVRAINLKFYDPLHLESRSTSMEDLLFKYMRYQELQRRG